MPEYPAVANHEVLLALIEAAERLSMNNYHVGITADFYARQRRLAKKTTFHPENLLLTLQKAGVLDFET
ncbi:hypothetical protein KAU85_01810 [Candidatus Bathyarchaeota archaeon]|nr:hypothetical protein [Candidatus Bathyarchaeota archaeon]